MIVRTVKDRENPYYLKNRSAPNDPRLSWKAKGIHDYLMSRHDQWEANVADLTNMAPDGESAVRSGIKELIKFGYMRRVREVDTEGKVKRWRLDTYEAPSLNPDFTEILHPDRDFPLVDEPHVENPLVENPLVENRDHNKYRSIVNNDLNNYKTTTTTIDRSSSEPTADRRRRQPSTQSSTSSSTRNRKTDAAYDSICTALENEGFGLMTPILAGQVNELMDRFPADWITRSIVLAVGQNIRTLAYVKGILNNMESEGFTHDQRRHHREKAGSHRQLPADNEAQQRQREYNKRYEDLTVAEYQRHITAEEADAQWQQLEADFPGFEYEEL